MNEYLNHDLQTSDKAGQYTIFKNNLTQYMYQIDEAKARIYSLVGTIGSANRQRHNSAEAIAMSALEA